MSAETTDALDYESLRADFPILGSVIHDDKPLVYLDNAASTQRPRQVIDALVGVYENSYGNVHRGSHFLSNRSTDLYEQARETVRSFINARSSQEVVFTAGTTMSINLVARSWGDQNVSSGDEILLTEMEHHSNIVPWQQLAGRSGATIRFLPLTDTGEFDVANLGAYLNERTKIVAFTAVSNVLGTVNPVEAIVSRAKECGATVLIDAAQSVPHLATDVQVWGADFIAFSGHKMLGPSGVGVLYGRQDLLESMPPFLGGGSMIRTVTKDGFTDAALPAKFEAGTPPIASVAALTAAIDYLEKVGLPAIQQHEHVLTEKAHDVLGQIPGLRFLGPQPSHKAGIVSFVLDGVDGLDVAHLVDQQGVAIRVGHHCAMPLHERFGVSTSCRASFYLYNRPEEVDVLGEAIDRAQRMLRA